MPGVLLHCPIRGTLNVPERASDGLTFTEEKRRVDCIKLLLSKNYPTSHIQVETTLWQFGSQGRNSFRTDIAVLDTPLEDIPEDSAELASHIVMIAEIKRDNASSNEALRTQVYPALNFLPSVNALGIYWDDVEQRLFYRDLSDGLLTVRETPIVRLPQWGQDFEHHQLHSSDLRTTNLRLLFERIEDRLHSEVSSKSRRFEIMQQLLLMKLYDEYVHPLASNEEMDIQDFAESPLGDNNVKQILTDILERSLAFYQPYLPSIVPTAIPCSGAMLRSLSSLLAPVRVLNTKRELVQDFYMYFASEVYKWDLGQYFTPTEVVDFIVEVVNPRAGEHVKDPACGSGDFLISAFQYAERRNGANIKDSVWGADNSAEAVQVAILNMVLNGDGKSQIKEEDSLLEASSYLNRFPVLLCNPPFGVRITETRREVLQQFDLGHTWRRTEDGHLDRSHSVARSQQVGILFAELCVRQAAPGGRVGIILPNGYLGNRSQRYLAFREWLIRHARIAAIVAFPRFTFKKSGADVSASAVFLEKRVQPLSRAMDAETHPFYAGIVESVGWSVSDKRAKRLFRRDARTGAYVTDQNNEPIPDNDLARVLAEVTNQHMLDTFGWLNATENFRTQSNWSAQFSEVTRRADLSLDPKRWSQRYRDVRSSVQTTHHFSLGDVADLIGEIGVPESPSTVFEYVEIQDAADGIVTPKRLRGWELPARARRRATRGDIFIGGVWGSVSKWFIAGDSFADVVASNGFKQLRMKPNCEDYLFDIVAGLVSETYLIQARALCTGSDGLAELGDDDISEILLPRITDPSARNAIQAVVDGLLAGRATMSNLVKDLQSQGALHPPPSDTRGTNWVQV